MLHLRTHTHAHRAAHRLTNRTAGTTLASTYPSRFRMRTWGSMKQCATGSKVTITSKLFAAKDGQSHLLEPHPAPAVRGHDHVRQRLKRACRAGRHGEPGLRHGADGGLLPPHVRPKVGAAFLQPGPHRGLKDKRVVHFFGQWRSRRLCSLRRTYSTPHPGPRYARQSPRCQGNHAFGCWRACCSVPLASSTACARPTLTTAAGRRSSPCDPHSAPTLAKGNKACARERGHTHAVAFGTSPRWVHARLCHGYCLCVYFLVCRGTQHAGTVTGRTRNCSSYCHCRAT